MIEEDFKMSVFLPENIILNTNKIVLNNKLFHTTEQNLYVEITDKTFNIFIGEGVVYKQNITANNIPFIKKLGDIIATISKANTLEMLLNQLLEHQELETRQTSQDLNIVQNKFKTLLQNEAICFNYRDFSNDSNILFSLLEKKAPVFDVDAKIQAINLIINFLKKYKVA